jgi:hypothetical protein
LYDDALLLRDIAAAEDDVRNGHERSLAEAMKLLDHRKQTSASPAKVLSD